MFISFENDQRGKTKAINGAISKTRQGTSETLHRIKNSRCAGVSTKDSSCVTNHYSTRHGGGECTHNSVGDVRSKAITCTPPKPDNPFMNVMLGDYTIDPDRGAACDIQEPMVAKQTERLFEQAGSGLIRNSDDIFHRSATSRQFVTNPSTTIPNDQSGFANWLYGNAPSFKTQHNSSSSPFNS